MRILIVCLLWVSLIQLVSCSNSGSGEDRFLKSYTFSTKSHNTGLDCMQCHKPGGEGEGIFTVAGSVFQLDKSTPNPNGMVYLSALANGREVEVELQVDALGNFYTTEPVAFGKGLYPQHKSSKDTLRFMSGTVTTGSCNSCHGRTTFVINNY